MSPVPRPPEAPELDLPDLDRGEEGDDVDIGVVELSMGEELDVEDGYGTADGFELGIDEQPDALADESSVDLDVGVAALLNPPLEDSSLMDSEEPEAPGAGLGLNLELPLESDDHAEVELGDDGLEALPELARDEADHAAGPDTEGGALPFVPEGPVPEGPAFQLAWRVRGEACFALSASGAEVFAASDRLHRYGDSSESHVLPHGARPSSLVAL